MEKIKDRAEISLEGYTEDPGPVLFSTDLSRYLRLRTATEQTQSSRPTPDICRRDYPAFSRQFSPDFDLPRPLSELNRRRISDKLKSSETFSRVSKSRSFLARDRIDYRISFADRDYIAEIKFSLRSG